MQMQCMSRRRGGRGQEKYKPCRVHPSETASTIQTKTIWEPPERARAPILELELELSDVGGEDGDVC